MHSLLLTAVPSDPSLTTEEGAARVSAGQQTAVITPLPSPKRVGPPGMEPSHVPSMMEMNEEDGGESDLEESLSLSKRRRARTGAVAGGTPPGKGSPDPENDLRKDRKISGGSPLRAKCPPPPCRQAVTEEKGAALTPAESSDEKAHRQSFMRNVFSMFSEAMSEESNPPEYLPSVDKKKWFCNRSLCMCARGDPNSDVYAIFSKYPGAVATCAPFFPRYISDYIDDVIMPLNRINQSVFYTECSVMCKMLCIVNEWDLMAPLFAQCCEMYGGDICRDYHSEARSVSVFHYPDIGGPLEPGVFRRMTCHTFSIPKPAPLKTKLQFLEKCHPMFFDHDSVGSYDMISTFDVFCRRMETLRYPFSLLDCAFSRKVLSWLLSDFRASRVDRLCSAFLRCGPSLAGRRFCTRKQVSGRGHFTVVSFDRTDDELCAMFLRCRHSAQVRHAIGTYMQENTITFKFAKFEEGSVIKNLFDSTSALFGPGARGKGSIVLSSGTECTQPSV